MRPSTAGAGVERLAPCSAVGIGTRNDTSMNTCPLHLRTTEKTGCGVTCVMGLGETAALYHRMFGALPPTHKTFVWLVLAQCIYICFERSYVLAVSLNEDRRVEVGGSFRRVSHRFRRLSLRFPGVTSCPAPAPPRTHSCKLLHHSRLVNVQQLAGRC